MRNLHTLGRLYNTDKHDEAHSFNGASYLDFYQRHLGPVRHLVTTVLELGVYQGASLRMWRDYFPKAVIHGLDIDPARSFEAVRIQVTIGSQANPDVLARVADGAALDLVVDDGSHVVDHMLTSFRSLWHRIKPGGFYIIEDLGTTYGDITPCVGIWPGQTYNEANTNFRNDRRKMVDAFEEVLHRMDTGQGDCAAVYHYPRVVIFEKAL